MRRELLGRWILPIRLVPLVLGLGYLLVLNGQTEATGDDWTLTLGATLLLTAGGRWPLVAALGQAVLLLVYGPTDARLGLAVVSTTSLFAVGELAWRRSGWQVWVGTVAVLMASLSRTFIKDLAPEVFGAVVTVALPLLLGMHLRSVQEIAWQAKQRAEADAQAARADERTAIARELHDLVAHHVASMVLRIGVARHVLDPDPKVAQVLDEVHASGTEAMADLRTLVTVLRSSEPVTAMDLLASLKAAVDRVEAAGPEVNATVDPDVANLDAVLRLAVLRVVQEGLTNVLKHAGPEAKAALSIQLDNGTVDVRLANDGEHQTKLKPGHGLIGMRERVELVGGSLQTGPTGSGWLVHARLPA